MNRQQRRAAKRETNRKTKLPVHLINKYRAKPSDYAERQYLNARIAAALADDDPPDRAHREAVWQRNEALINDAVYCRELDTVIPLLSQVVLETELALRFYDDLPEAAPYLEQVRQARAVLEREIRLRDGSPNQRRALFAPLRDLNDGLYGLMSITPTGMLHNLSAYIDSLRVRWAHHRYYSKGVQTCTATVRIINGESLRAVAKECGIKENLLKEQVLNAAQSLYTIGLFVTQTENIRPANAIPELRTDEYKTISASLKSAANAALEECEKFERHFGISASGEIAKAERALAEQYRKMH